MKQRLFASTLLAGLMLCGLLSCTSMTATTREERPAADSRISPVDGSGRLEQTYAGLRERGGRVFTLDPQQSAVRIFAFRAGPAARVAHNHVLTAPTFTGFYHLPAAGALSGRFDVVFRLDQLLIDSPELRAAYGPAFASTLDAAAVEGTREHMLGSDSLDANRFPFVRIHSLDITGEAPKFAARVQAELHGQSREMWIPLDVSGLPGQLEVSGSFIMRQSDFGARPYSVLGGLIAVQDEVVIEFKLVGR